MSIYKEIIGQGEDVVLMHGWGCSHLHMQPILEMLSNTYRVTNVDLPGCGNSDWSVNIESVHDMADQLLNDLPEKAIYIGWSVGGLVAMSIVARFPERATRFIGIGTTPKFVEDDKWLGVPKPGFSAVYDQLKELGYREFFKNIYEEEFQDFEEKPQAFYDLLEILEREHEPDLEMIQKGNLICDKTDLRDAFKKIQCSIDLILGEKDTAVKIDSVNQLKQLNPNVRIHIIPGARHVLQ